MWRALAADLHVMEITPVRICLALPRPSTTFHGPLPGVLSLKELKDILAAHKGALGRKGAKNKEIFLVEDARFHVDKPLLVPPTPAPAQHRPAAEPAAPPPR